MAAMGIPSGSKIINGRFMRHFNIFAFTSFENESLQRIYSTIVSWWTSNNGVTSAAKVK